MVQFFSIKTINQLPLSNFGIRPVQFIATMTLSDQHCLAQKVNDLMIPRKFPKDKEELEDLIFLAVYVFLPLRYLILYSSD